MITVYDILFNTCAASIIWFRFMNIIVMSDNDTEVIFLVPQNIVCLKKINMEGHW